jgi:hypothetical protein
MNLIRWVEGWRFVLLVVLTVILLRGTFEFMQDDFEISLTIGESWEQMRERSYAAVGPVPVGGVWSNKSRAGVRLRFNDPEFGFVTPLARDFRINSKYAKVRGVRLSPQMEPLSLDDALLVVLGLHKQLREKCWVEARVMDDPPIADSSQWRAWFHARTEHAMSFWLADDKYQLMIDLKPANPRSHRTVPRFRVVLSLDEPWLPLARPSYANGCKR